MIDKTHIVKNNKTMLYITYTILLAFVVFNYKTVLSTIGYILSLATPLYIAIVIAFILNIPMRKIAGLWQLNMCIIQKALIDALFFCQLFITFIS